MNQSTSATNDFELLNDEQVQQQHANQIAVQVFHGEENAKKRAISLQDLSILIAASAMNCP
ncbi:hypothetical protein [Chromatium okenii]|nr:hypothetical protein [Chromatium okenii]